MKLKMQMESGDILKQWVNQITDLHFNSRYIKRILDIILSFAGLILLSPVFAIIALAIKVEDPGPVMFVQKRCGQNKRYFKLHKFRSMKMDTPHDVPTQPAG